MFLTLLTVLLFCSPLIFLAPKRWKAWGALTIVGAGVVAVAGIVAEVYRFGNVVLWEGRSLMFGAESLGADPLAALLLIVIATGGVAVTLYSKGYLKDYIERRSGAHLSLHYVSLTVLFLSMIFVVLCRGGFWFLASWEVMTIASFVLIMFDAGKKEVRKAALNYLILMHVGFVFIVAGFVTLHAAGLPATFESIALYCASHNPMPLFLLFLVGFGMKAGVFPLHIWLPEAHPAAPSHISALMSGVMIKMGVYGVLRTAMGLGADHYATAGTILFALGAVTGIYGVLLAAIQTDIKRLLAYSSIENIGIIFLATGAWLMALGTGNTFAALCALSGALLHTLGHSLFKVLLFFGAGNIYSRTHTTAIESLGGVAKKMPLTAALFVFATAAICALPPLGGFVSEFMIYFGFASTLASGSGGVLAALGGLLALSLVGGMVVIAFTKLYGVVFQGTPRSAAVGEAREAETESIAAAALPVAGILLIGFAPGVIVPNIFKIAARMSGMGDASYYTGKIADIMEGISATSAILTGIVLVLWLWRGMALRKRAIDRGPTWGCGFTAPNARMQYTGESFTEGLQSIATSLTKTTSEGSAVDKGETFPGRHNFAIRRRDKIEGLFNAWWVELLKMVNSRVMRLRTGKVNNYVLYALLFFLVVLILSLLGML